MMRSFGSERDYQEYTSRTNAEGLSLRGENEVRDDGSDEVVHSVASSNPLVPSTKIVNKRSCCHGSGTAPKGYDRGRDKASDLDAPVRDRNDGEEGEDATESDDCQGLMRPINIRSHSQVIEKSSLAGIIPRVWYSRPP